MHSFFTAAALVASASLSLAAPSNVVGRSTFELKQVSVGKVLKNGPQQMMKTYQKFAKAGAVAPADVVAAAAAQQTGTVAATPEQYDSAYTVPVTLGNSQLNLDIDSGSSDLWVFSTDTPGATGHNTYNPSTGTKLDGYTWSITYGDGSGASGDVYADKVVVGGVTATSQAVEAATSISSQFQQNTASDGLMGLAFSSINQVQPKPQTTFFDTVAPTLQKALYTADLKAGAPGSYGFGFIDSSKYTGSITYVAVDNSQGFWQFTAGGTNSGSSGTNTTEGDIGTAIADTGTSLMYLPTDTVKQYYSGVQGSTYDSTQGGYTVPCSSTLPDFGVSIGGKTFTVPGAYINYAPITSGGSDCFGGIQANTGIGFTIFGDVFLKSVYAIFDNSQSSPRLGFAAQSAAQQSS